MTLDCAMAFILTAANYIQHAIGFWSKVAKKILKRHAKIEFMLQANTYESESVLSLKMK